MLKGGEITRNGIWISKLTKSCGKKVKLDKLNLETKQAMLIGKEWMNWCITREDRTLHQLISYILMCAVSTLRGVKLWPDQAKVQASFKFSDLEICEWSLLLLYFASQRKWNFSDESQHLCKVCIFEVKYCLQFKSCLGP